MLKLIMANFRKFKTSSGKKVLAGRDAETNEKLIGQAGKQEIVLHTAKPGSPFVNIKGKAGKQDIEESAIFTAKYSQAWKKAKVKKDIEVHIFKGRDIYKSKEMKLGTFEVKKHKKILIKKEDIENFGGR